MGLFSKFRKSASHNSEVRNLTCDMHSHLIPGIDDGADTFEDAQRMISRLHDEGFRQIITTPHIMGDFYKNGKENIFPGRDKLREWISKENLNMEFHAAAEYYLDEWFPEKLKQKESVLSFGSNYLLFETSYMNRPANLSEVVFQIQTAGFKPVLAHPERYTYLYQDFGGYEELFEKGLLFQLNINSLSGYYSGMAKKIAEKLIDKQMVHFLGTDCHGMRHLDAFEKAKSTKHFQKALTLPLLNFSL